MEAGPGSAHAIPLKPADVVCASVLRSWPTFPPGGHSCYGGAEQQITNLVSAHTTLEQVAVRFRARDYNVLVPPDMRVEVLLLEDDVLTFVCNSFQYSPKKLTSRGVHGNNSTNLKNAAFDEIELRDDVDNDPSANFPCKNFFCCSHSL